MPVQTGGQLKQAVVRIYNQVNQEIFRVGTRTVKVELLGPHLLILAEHCRLPSQSILDQSEPSLSRMVDLSLIDRFKVRLRQRLAEELQLPIRSLLKDYDPKGELAATVVILH